jgi:small conductance mechanosensitive channel
MKLQQFYNKAYDIVLQNWAGWAEGIIILLIGLWVIRFLKSRLRDRMSRREVHSSLRPFFLSLVITSLYVLLLIMVLDIVGLHLTFLTTIIGAFGVAAGLALSGTLQNFAGGVLILMLKPFEIDDSIVAQNQEGKVSSIQLFYTVVITPDNKTVIIPNGKLFNEVIVNVSREGMRRMDFNLKLGYVVDVDQVKDIITKAMIRTPGVLKKPASRIGVISLELDGIVFATSVWVKPSDFLTVKMELQENVVKDLKAAGIKLPGT